MGITTIRTNQMKSILFAVWAFICFAIHQGNHFVDLSAHPAKILFMILWTIVCIGFYQVLDPAREN
jgi:hypothetical protein